LPNKGLVYEEVSTEPRAGTIPHGTIEIIENDTDRQGTIASTVFSNVPVVWNAELSREYLELGSALKGMAELQEGDEWRIDAPVYATACYVASELRDSSYPAPSVFTHGPESVVFNWSNGANNLYLTITSDRMSALVSTPERITRRIDYQPFLLANPSEAILALQSAYSGQPVGRLLSPSVFSATPLLR
jgi:hypothetical protein